jgi:hypothetical protein
MDFGHPREAPGTELFPGLLTGVRSALKTTSNRRNYKKFCIPVRDQIGHDMSRVQPGPRGLSGRSVRDHSRDSTGSPLVAPTGQARLADSPQADGRRGAGRGILWVRGQPRVAGLTYGSLGRAPVEVTGDRIVPNATVDSRIDHAPSVSNRTSLGGVWLFAK